MIRKKGIAGGWYLSITICFMFFIYAPLEMFFLNQIDFFFDLYILLPVLGILFALSLCLCILFFLMLKKLGDGSYFIGLCGMFIAFICSYIQGNFLVEFLPVLDGNWVEWDKYPLERMKCIGVWIGVTLVVVIMYKAVNRILFEKIVLIISVCMGLMLLVTVSIIGISKYDFKKKEIYNTTTKDLFAMSTNENFIILLLDAVDAQTFTQVVNEDPDYRDIFDDFTAFNNTVGATPSTRESIPYILTGKWYEKQSQFEEYEKQAYRDSPLFQMLENKGYLMGVYEEELLLDEEEKRFDNVVTCKRSVTSYLTFARWQVQMVGFRYAPFDLKRFCFINPMAFNTLKVSPNAEEQFVADNINFYEKIQTEEIKLVDESCFKFIHIEGGHVPFQYNAKVERINNGTYEDNLRACLTITNAYLNKLRDENVYDNSVIIIMADHGYDNCIRSNPILYIKGVGEKHKFQVSDAPISYEDLQGAYSKLLQGKDSKNCFEYQEGDVRKRRFLLDTDGGPIYEYIQSGHAADETTINKTGVVYE